MPYFERKPFSEMFDPSVNPMPETPEAEDFTDLARSVLASETGPQHGLAGPFRVKAPIEPGNDGRLTVEIAVDNEGGPLELSLTSGDLRGPPGTFAIPADMVSIRPKQVRLAPGDDVDVVVTISVPLDTPAGLYRGRIAALGEEPVMLIIEIEVDEDIAAKG